MRLQSTSQPMKGNAVTEKTQLLIVEDDLDLSEMLNAYFRVQGYDVKTAAWGEEAVSTAQKTPPALVVLDIRLPDIDGYEVCRRLRAHRRTQAVPIIFLTEKRDRVDKLSGLELGVVDYITKPFDIQELRLRVRNALQRANTPSLINPVTNLPEGTIVDEKLTQLIASDSSWAVLIMRIQGLDDFREMYGFVASDDVLRAVSLMMNNAVNEAGRPEDFIGHIDSHNFVIITDVEHLKALRERIEMRLSQSIEYFYPLKDRDKAKLAMDKKRLKITMGQIDHTHSMFADLGALKVALKKAHDDPTP